MSDKTTLPLEDLTLKDLAKIVCGGIIDGELQEKVTHLVRTDPRCTESFAKLDAMETASGADDVLEGLRRHEEVDRLLAAKAWEDPAAILNPRADDLYEVSYRELLAVAESRLATADAPRPIERLQARLLKAEQKQAANAVFQVAEALRNLSVDTAEKVFEKVRRKYWSKERAGGK